MDDKVPGVGADGLPVEERFLLAYVSEDTRVIGIEHPTEAAWDDVLAAHVALRDWLNVRIRKQRRCPFRALTNTKDMER